MKKLCLHYTYTDNGLFSKVGDIECPTVKLWKLKIITYSYILGFYMRENVKDFM